MREGAVIGEDCILGKGAYVDKGVRLGDRCKLQNGASVFHGFTLEDGVFVGPGAMLLNDKHPRAINPDGSLKTDADWVASEGVVHHGAAIGGGVVILPGVSIGRMAMVGAGAVVISDVPDRCIVAGNPARVVGYACDCGHRLGSADPDGVRTCPSCGRKYDV
ncbi:MAG TPA: acyltransferase [Candidatus Dormibacteraeota bacterium]|nr:acyltransferase [Candidatus Dormibacteraeota bacterium]